MSSSLANGTCAAPWLATSRTTTGLVLTSRSTRMHPTAGQLSGRNSAGSSRFAKSVASTIATSDGPPDPAESVRDDRARPSVRLLAPTPKRSASFSGGPADLLAAPPIYSLLAFLGLSREHRPSSTEWDEVLAKDKSRPVDGHAVRLEVHEVARHGGDALEDRLSAARAGALAEVAALSREAGGGRRHAGDDEHPTRDGLVHRSVESDGNARGDVEAGYRAQAQHDAARETPREDGRGQRFSPTGDGPQTALTPRRLNRVCARRRPTAAR